MLATLLPTIFFKNPPHKESYRPWPRHTPTMSTSLHGEAWSLPSSRALCQPALARPSQLAPAQTIAPIQDLHPPGLATLAESPCTPRNPCLISLPKL